MTTFSMQQRERALRLVRRFESGSADGDYTAVAVLNDGAGVSYGAFQFTHRSGLLAEVIERYLSLSGGGKRSEYFRRILPTLRRRGPATIRKTAADREFRHALAVAGLEPEMQRAQREIAEARLIGPAAAECGRIGFATALGLAVVLDSITHGSWEKIAAKTDVADRERPERERIIRYLEARQKWLLSSRRLRPTVYRTATLLEYARKGNLELDPRFRNSKPDSASPEQNSSAAVSRRETAALPEINGGISTENSAASANTSAEKSDADPPEASRPMSISFAAESAARGLETAFDGFDRADRLIDGLSRRSERLRTLWAAAIAGLWQTVWAIFGFFAGLPLIVWLVVAVICAAITIACLLRHQGGRKREVKQ